MRKRAAETEGRYRRLLAEQAGSGLSVRAFAKASGVPAGTLSSWKHELKKRDGVRGSRSASPASFVPVRVVGEADGVPSSAGYEVLVGALVLRLPRDFEVSRVAALVKAVASC